MANVDAEHNTAPAQQMEGTAPSEFTLSEENLEALLHGVSGTAPLPKPAAPPAPAGAMQKPSTPDRSTQIEPARKEEPIASLASLQGAPPLEAVPPPPFAAAPVAVTPLQTTPQAAPQPDVNSKLALISAIKQRRAVTGAVTVKPEAPAPETESYTPVARATGDREPEQEEIQSAVEDAAVDVDEEEIAPPSQTISVSPSRSPRVGNAPLPQRPTKVAPEIEPQKALPAKKVWTNGTAAPGEREPRRADALRTDTARPESAKKVMPKATVAAPVVEAPDASESNELFASFASGLPEQNETKPGTESKNFISSKAGMGVIGGAVAAAALAVYFFTAHGAPKESAAVKASAAPVEVASTIPPTAPSSDGKASASASATNQHAPTAPITAQVPGPKSAVTAQIGGQPARQIPAGNPQQIPAAQQSVVSQPVVPEAPRTAARAFTAPTAARPASSPVVDAAPALAINTATPTGVGLPARIAPLPPPPAPPTPAAAQAAAPKQLNVAGALQAAKITRQVVPQYPAVAKAARVQGTVHFRALIGADGTVKALTTLGGPLPLAQAAADAVKQWRYQPTLVDGKPVEVTTQIDVAFTL